MTFKEGDIVNRIIGGPLMTVEMFDETRRDDLVSCVWFNISGEAQRDTFAACTLRKWVNVTHEIG